MKTAIQWKRWNLDYTKEVMDRDPESPMALALLSCWSPRIQQALVARFQSQQRRVRSGSTGTNPLKERGKAAPL